MVARIHYRESGVEYVLQYNASTDTIELRKNTYTLIGGIPNYFRDEWGTYVYEMRVFKETLLDRRPLSCFSTPRFPLPLLSQTEVALIYEFEGIADINLLLTNKSVREHRFRLMQEHARAMPDLDISALIQAFNQIGSNASAVLSELTHSLRLNFPPDPALYPSRYANCQLQGTEAPPPTDEPPISQEPPSIDLDDLLQEIDEVLDEPTNDDDTVRAAPSHRFEIPAETMSELWKNAKKSD